MCPWSAPIVMASLPLLPTNQYNGPRMSDTPSPGRFKAEMPDIPGVKDHVALVPHRNARIAWVVAGLAVLCVAFFAIRWLTSSKPVETSHAESPAQLEVPSPPPDPSTLVAHATEIDPTITSVARMSRAWSSIDFFVKNKLTGENIPATIVRLPGGSAAQASSYYAFSRRPIAGDCELEFVADLEKLKNDYGYKFANHPLVGNPCSHTLYDPLKTANLPGNVWIRGAIVQGSDIRPPYLVEIRVKGQDIQALRTE